MVKKIVWNLAKNTPPNTTLHVAIEVLECGWALKSDCVEILNDEKAKDVLKKFFALLLTWQQSEKRGEVKKCLN